MESETLAEAYPKEQQRCRELLELYEGLGAPGAFGFLAISGILERADKAAAEQDTVAMLAAYEEMRGCE